MTTLREMIQERSQELSQVADLGPQRASQILVELSSLLSTLYQDIAEKRYWVNVLKMTKMDELGSAAKGKIAAEASLEWKELHAREMVSKAVEEQIKALKYYLREQETDRRLTP